MAIFDTTDFTLSQEEIKSINEVIFEDSFKNPSIDAFHKVVEGIVAKKRIVILGKIQGLLGKGSGECDPTSSTNQVESTSKTWDPVIISDRLEQCYKDLMDSFWVYMLQQGKNKADVTTTEFAAYLTEVMNDAIFETILRFAWLGDTNADTIANGGYLKNGTDTDYFNKLDGFWVQVLAIVAANATRKTSTTISTRNAGASYSAQAFTTADTTNKVVSEALTNLRLGADLRLREKTNLVYVCTQSVADQYERELINANISFTTERLEGGITVLRNGGIEIFAFSLLDRIIQTYQDNGTKWNNPHRLILTTKDNLGVGVESVGALDSLDIFYDKKTKKNYVDFMVSMDAKIFSDNLIQATY